MNEQPEEQAKAPKEEPPKEAPNSDEAKKRGKQGIILFTLVLSALAVTAFCAWFFYFRFYKFTEDAYVHGNIIYSRPQITGVVSDVFVQETHLVHEGDVLVLLDPTDTQLVLDQASAALGETIRNVTTLFENVYQALADYRAQEADRVQAEILYKDRLAVVSEGAVSKEEAIKAETRYIAATASTEEAKHQLISAVAHVQNTSVRTHPTVVEAAEKVRQAFVNRKRCTILSPCTGIVALRAVQVGEAVSPEVNLLAVVPLDQMWVNANYRETALKYLSVGQRVRLRSDAFGSQATYYGTIEGIGAGTGAVFSPLPPQNATGNWIKIVQRIPVRIHIPTEQLLQHPLRLGLSMSTRVDIRDKNARTRFIPKIPPETYQTDIFHRQTAGSEDYIDDIIQTNMLHNVALSDEITQYVRQL